MGTDFPLPDTLAAFQRHFPADAACAAFMEQVRWDGHFVCPYCAAAGEPFRFAGQPTKLRCRSCHAATRLTVRTIMEGTRLPLTVWFSAAYLIATDPPFWPSPTTIQRSLGLRRYETTYNMVDRLSRRMRAAVRKWPRCTPGYAAKYALCAPVTSSPKPSRPSPAT